MSMRHELVGGVALLRNAEGVRMMLRLFMGRRRLLDRVRRRALGGILVGVLINVNMTCGRSAWSAHFNEQN